MIGLRLCQAVDRPSGVEILRQTAMRRTTGRETRGTKTLENAINNDMTEASVPLPID